MKQGDPLSTISFSTVMEMLMRKLEIRRNITTRLKQTCVYADGVVLVTGTAQGLDKHIPEDKAGDREI